VNRTMVVPTYFGTSGCNPITQFYNDFASAVALLACRITNAASELDTAESLHLWINSADRITSIDTPQRALGVRALDVSTPSATIHCQNSEALFELRLLTEFTWDQIARLFSVSRRTVHLWAGDAPMSRENEEHLHRMLGILRRSNRGSTDDNRAALLSSDPSLSRCAFDCLAARDYESALQALESLPETYRAPASRLVPSSDLLAERAPLPPDVLLSARHDHLSTATRHGRAVRYRKVARKL
jgi:hypothetical protein